jgi:phage-related minor tail protein
MLTEYEVRRRIELIRASRIAPLRKARLLLRMGKSLNKQAQTLSTASERSTRTTDQNGSASLARIAVRLRMLNQDVRDAAHEALARDS